VTYHAAVRQFGSAVLGFALEFTRLALVIAGAGMVSVVAGPMEAGRAVFPVVLIAVYALFTIVPARDVVRGWLGMFAHAVPDGFDDDGENVGRAVADVIMFAGVVVLLVWMSGEVVDEAGSNADSEAFLAAFLAFEMLVFGLGGAVPRIWFVWKSVPAPAKPPELLVQAGKRAAVFSYCAFVSIGLALTAGQLVAGTRGLRRPRHHIKPAPPPPPFHKLVAGSLCQPARADCDVVGVVDVVVPHPGRFRVRFSSHDQLPPCIARGLHGHEPIDDLASGQPAIIDANWDEIVGVGLNIDEDVAQCGYRVEIDEVTP
jgi:hypothetical protein